MVVVVGHGLIFRIGFRGSFMENPYSYQLYNCNCLRQDVLVLTRRWLGLLLPCHLEIHAQLMF